jgi:uncharacterized protein
MRTSQSLPLLVRPSLVSAAILVAALAAAPAAHTAAVAGLYEATVTGDAADAKSAEEALRQVAVRLTGRRSAGSDPALSALYGDARRYVQTLRSAGAGQVTVSFDPNALDAALVQAGQPLWSRERPATLVLLLGTRAGGGAMLAAPDSSERRAMEQAATERGVPLVWPQAGTLEGATRAMEQAGPQRDVALLDYAHRNRAEAVLLGRASGSEIAWSALGPGAGAALGGDPAQVVNQLADHYAQAMATSASAGITTSTVVIRGITDLKAYAATLAYLSAVSDVRSVAVDEANADTVRYSVSFRGDNAALDRALRLGGQLAAEPGSGDATLRFRRLP